MLQLIRTMAVEKRWVLGLVFGTVAVVFVFSMGWMGMSAPSGVYAAKVNGREILLADYARAYQNQYKQYERLYGEQFNADLAKAMGLRERVLWELVDQLLWVDLATSMGLTVSDAELRDQVTRFPAFQVNNRFDSAHYKRALARAGLAPEVFESSVRQDMLAAKAQELVRAGAQVTRADLVVFAQNPDGDLSEAERAERDQQRLTGLLGRKQGQMLAAFAGQLRAQAELEVFWDAVKTAAP
ncbi:MAG: SurA N-terminal domain-containing protein [Nitrospirae bacterium]|nr:SurA N-terminal domain-containing protein [Nitrospirota bacterium]